MRRTCRNTSLIYRYRAKSGVGRVRSAHPKTGGEMPADLCRCPIGTFRGAIIVSNGAAGRTRQSTRASVTPTNPHRVQRVASGARCTT
jgi:hypothetical protein